jgi:Predicted membrane protein
MRLGSVMEFSSQWWLLAIGFIGQSFFFMRFFWQWIASEKAQKSIIPVNFWYFSLFGSCFLLAYAILRRDIVFIIGQSTGLIIYIRNIFLIQREKNKSIESMSRADTL